MLWVEDLLGPASSTAAENFIAKRTSNLLAKSAARRIALDPTQAERRVGVVKTLKEDAGYGFVKSGKDHFFFHARSLWDPEWFESLKKGSVLLFTLGQQPTQTKPEATSVHWVR
jgi:cold shock CspA family protein